VTLLGALQSICYQKVGRYAVKESDGLLPLIAFLNSPDEKVRMIGMWLSGLW
jgi:hypothetical protein